MKIKGAEGMTAEQLNWELRRGGKLVVFHYCVSPLVLTYRGCSGVYLIKAGEGTLGKSIGFTLLTLVAGWWGIPWGPIRTVSCLTTNFGGGEPVSSEVLAALTGPAGAT